jgi:hypothetical protein
VWERYVSGDSHAAESASAVTASDQMVYVVGTTADSNGDLGFTVHAYDHAGKLVWNDRYNQVPGKSGYDVARCAVLQGSRLFVAGTTETAKNNRDFTVRAYDALGNKNGTANLLWWEDFNRASHVDANARLVKDDEALAIAADSYHVYVVGYTSDYHKERPLRVKDQDFSIRVYSVKKTQATGDNPGGAHVLWWDYLDGVDMGGNVDGASVAHAVAVFKDRIYVGGQMEKHTSDPDSYVIAYPVANDPPAPEKRAKYLWQDIYEDADHTCKGGSDATYGIAVDQDGVYTAGMLENPEGNSDLCTVVFKP